MSRNLEEFCLLLCWNIIDLDEIVVSWTIDILSMMMMMMMMMIFLNKRMFLEFLQTFLQRVTILMIVLTMFVMMYQRKT
jgi:hypothetical protein